MSGIKILKIFIISSFFTSYLYLFIFYIGHQDKSQTLPQDSTIKQLQTKKSFEKVIRVIDGDTFEIDGGIKVRLIGVDTPELKGGKDKRECLSLEAKGKLESLILNKDIYLEKDISETDKYGRLLRYVYLDSLFINDLLVKDGYAKISTYPPDVANTSLFLESEKYARNNKLGLWSLCQ